MLQRARTISDIPGTVIRVLLVCVAIPKRLISIPVVLETILRHAALNLPVLPLRYASCDLVARVRLPARAWRAGRRAEMWFVVLPRRVWWAARRGLVRR